MKTQGHVWYMSIIPALKRPNRLHRETLSKVGMGVRGREEQREGGNDSL